MKRKSFLALVLTISLSLLLTACGSKQTAKEPKDGSAPADSGEIIILKAGHSLPDTHPYELGLQEAAKNIEERTNGRVIIETFPNSQLGAERELTEGLTLGTVDIVVSSTAPITNFVPELGVLDLPFLFNSRDAAVEVLNGEIGDELKEKMEERGIMVMSWAENGFRHITNSKRPIRTPEDLKGLKIRTQENEYHIAAFEALGAQPTPMAWTEALTGLQQGVVDAQENPIIVADQFNLYDSNQKYMTLTGHVYSVAVYMLSKITYDKLPEDLRAIVVEELAKAGPFERDLLVKMDQESLTKVKDQGMEVIEDVDITPFREAIKSVYAKYENQDLLNRILEAQK